MKRTYIVPKMMCGGCQKAIDAKLMNVSGISYEINLENKTVVVYFNGEIDDHKVISAIRNAGYEAARL
ncbi:MAG: heavy metal-associated domain-containing protein [Bacilli bacterium]|nr:heavy metal-associated domain-containing protein [Bacilli bacterium]